MSETRKMTLPVLMFARENEEFRKFLWNVDNTQLVLMAMPEEDEIGGEVHEGHDQSLYFVAGSGEAKIGDVETKTADGEVGVVPSGTFHNFRNYWFTDAEALHQPQPARVRARRRAKNQSRSGRLGP